MEKIRWCLKTKKGIEVVEQNSNLSKAYLEKSENASKAAVSVKGNKTWEICSSYYAMYFALYSILMKIGIKCENHTCTIEFMKEFLSDYFTKDDKRLMKKSVGLRIEAQYYLAKEISEFEYKKLVEQAPKFIAKCKDVRIKIKEAEIKEIRGKVKEMKNPKKKSVKKTKKISKKQLKV